MAPVFSGQPEQFRLIDCVVQCLVIANLFGFENGGHPARPGIRPTAAGYAHVECLDVQRCETERVFPKIFVEVVIHE